MAYRIPYGGHKNNGKRKLATNRQSTRRQFRTQMLSRYADALWQSYCGSVMLFWLRQTTIFDFVNFSGAAVVRVQSDLVIVRGFPLPPTCLQNSLSLARPSFWFPRYIFLGRIWNDNFIHNILKCCCQLGAQFLKIFLISFYASLFTVSGWLCTIFDFNNAAVY